MEIVWLNVIVFIASVLQSGTGFGFAIMSIPFLMLLFESHAAIQLNIILTLVVCVIMAYKKYNEVNKEKMVRLIQGSIAGILPGILLFVFLDVWLLKIIVSILILISSCLLITKISIKQSKLKEQVTGALSGLLTASMGMPGPPLMIYFSGSDIDKATLRSTTLAYFVFVCFFSLVFQFLLFDIPERVWSLAALALPATLIGIYLGQWVFTKLNQQLFKNIINIILFFTGIYMLITTL